MCHTVLAMMRIAFGTCSVNHSTCEPPISPMKRLRIPPKLSSKSHENATAPTRLGSTYEMSRMPRTSGRDSVRRFMPVATM